MAYTATRLTSNKVKITFGVPAETFEAATQSAYLKNRGRINVPGFRRGKAPRRLIERMYGENVFFEDAFETVFPGVYQEAVDGEAIVPVSRPEINIEQMKQGEELKFSIEVFVKPEVTLGEYKGIKATKYVPPVEDEQIDRRIQQDVRRATIQQEVTDRPAQDGDNVELDYLGTVDGVPFEGGKDEHAHLTLGSGRFIPGFEEQIVGMIIGEEKDLNVRFPDTYHAAELAGKDAVFHVKLHGITQDMPPELNDEFAADVSEFTTFDEYRASIIRELEKQRDSRADEGLEENLIQQAVDAADMDIPDAMIDDEVNRALQRMQLRLAYSGLKIEDYMKKSGMDIRQMADTYRPAAQAAVKRALVLEAIRKAEGLQATKEDVDEAIRRFAESMGRDAEEFAKSVTEEQRHTFEDEALTRKVVELIRNSAEVTVEERAEPTLEVGRMAETVAAAADAAEAAQEGGQEAAGFAEASARDGGEGKE